MLRQGARLNNLMITVTHNPHLITLTLILTTAFAALAAAYPSTHVLRNVLSPIFKPSGLVYSSLSLSLSLSTLIQT